MRKTVSVLLALLIWQGTTFAQAVETAHAPLTCGVVHELKSKVLNQTRKLNVYLPEGYTAGKAETYPVIYLLDGGQNEDFMHITGLVQFLTMIEAMPKTIVVGIVNVNRRKDFTFPAELPEDLKDFGEAGGSAKFMEYIAAEVQPFIAKQYRTNGEKTVIGQSLGGLFASEVLLKRPELFNNYIIISPSLWWGEEVLLKSAPTLLRNSNQPLRAYLSVGTEGEQMENDAKQFAEYLKKAPAGRISVTFAPMPEEDHLTILHNSAYKALVFLNKH